MPRPIPTGLVHVGYDVPIEGLIQDALDADDIGGCLTYAELRAVAKVAGFECGMRRSESVAKIRELYGPIHHHVS